MAKYKFYQDLKIKVWQRNSFVVEGSSKEEAIEKAKKFKDHEIFETLDGWESEIIPDTQVTLEPCENEGKATIQVWDVETSRMVASNRLRDTDFMERYYNWAEIGRNLRKSCIDYIRGVLKGLDGEMIVLDPKSMDEEMQDEFQAVTVPYDGGNHPEYNSNCFSQVNAAYLKGNDIYLDIDETDEYSIDNIDIQDIENIAELVKSIIDFKNRGYGKMI